MKKEILHAKFQGFQFGIEVAKQLVNEGKKIEQDEAIKMARSIADEEFTTTDPENSGKGFDVATEMLCKNIAMESIKVQRDHARDVCDGVVTIINDRLQDA
jgi:alpha/beta superfamily hydrolase